MFSSVMMLFANHCNYPTTDLTRSSNEQRNTIPSSSMITQILCRLIDSNQHTWIRQYQRSPTPKRPPPPPPLHNQPHHLPPIHVLHVLVEKCIFLPIFPTCKTLGGSYVANTNTQFLHRLSTWLQNILESI